MRDLLQNQLGIPRRNIQVLTDGAATTQAILRAFETQLVSGVRASDSVVFFFSGHGSRCKDQDGDEKDGWGEMLITYDTTAQNPETWLTDDRMRKLIAKLPTKNAWIVIDSCHSGDVLLGPGSKPKSYPAGVLPKSDPLGFADRLSPGGDPWLDFAFKGLLGSLRGAKKRPYVYFGACQPDEEAWEALIGSKYFMVGGNSGGSDENIFTADGETVFLNAANTLIPEPSSLSLLGLGALLLCRRRRA